MDIDKDTFNELIATFSAEMAEQSQLIINSILALESKGLSTEEHKQAIESLFRAAHTIKGAAGSIAFTEVSKIAHALESALLKYRNTDLQLTKEMTNLCLESVDMLKLAFDVDAGMEGKKIDSTDLIAKLEKTYNNQSKSAPASPKVSAKPKPSDNMRKTTDAAPSSTQSDSMRIDVGSLDKITSLMDEVSLNRIAISEQSAKFSKTVQASKKFRQIWRQMNRELQNVYHDELPDNILQLQQSANDALISEEDYISSHHRILRNRLNELNILYGLLQHEIYKLRLVPASVLFCTMPRYVRDLSMELGKETNLKITGDNVKIDKMVLDQIKDPVIHLLRNAIDHGIEDAEIRRKNKKPAVGNININIKDMGNQISIAISDDGRGIDIDAVKATAKKSSIVGEAELDNMDEMTITNLIFESGFSTKQNVTDVSGRGVGLDVVKTNMLMVNGTVSVESKKEKGTIFTLLLPLTLSSERGLIIKSNNSIFAIPCHAIERTMVINKNDVVDAVGSQLISVEGRSVQMHLLSGLLELSTDYIGASNDMVTIVLVKIDNSRAALLVDEVIGEREIVIKKLYAPLDKVPCVAGGTLSDGNEVIIVLNPRDIIQKIMHKSEFSRIVLSEKQEVIVERPTILVVDDSITTRTLEKNILESKNYCVSVATNGKEAWEQMQNKMFSVIITDLNMPVMDGFQLTEKIKQSDKFKHIPVIMVTSLDSEAEKKRGLAVGANAYIVKSEFESGALLEIVEQMV